MPATPTSSRLLRLLPGLGLSFGVTLLAVAVEQVEQAFLGGGWLGSLVLAIIIGAGIRSSVRLGPALLPGIDFSARTLLEVAVVLLGASISVAAIREAGATLVIGIAAIVATSLGFSYLICRALGLSARLATLVACGNSICGNSAIAATAPVIGANADEIASSIAFTAILGVGAVLLMPLLPELLGLSALQYGAFAGLTVYAVPQVLAATAPAGLVSMQTGTLVKLVRVMMLGPVIFSLGLAKGAGCRKISLHQLVPWFIVGFALMMALRSANLIPGAALEPIAAASHWLTIIAMAALGLSVDIRQAARAGGRVIASAVLSLAMLCLISLALVQVVHLG
ncbi:putative sulfate exporter family transporter [Rhizobium sp. RU36D]|uniref:YeiH family protein n=1 Tax=Rhizobium sp. RU36D TaxID=1907415 RepID=UPI0009D8CEAD|nr:putative sulfate exporter family transporter [Rhizobium sp. RU36D]SMD16698.1 conserved hypothetical integral membrane protein [Rhizobium sp. RU36D]